MKKLNFFNLLNVVLIVMGMACFSFKTIVAEKQLSAGIGWLIQNGKTVGQVYVPDYPKGSCYYVEHWYVDGSYVYPGENSPIELVIQPVPNLKYSGLSEFRDKMKKAFPSGHYIKVEAFEEISGCPSL